MYLFKQDWYFSGISAEWSALINEYASLFVNKEL